MQDNPFIPDKFDPVNSGTFNRLGTREQIQVQGSSALDQTIGLKATQESNNANSVFFQGQIDFPQPSIVGFGKVTSSGDKSTPFLSDRWSVVKNSTGNYTITHNIGFTNYVPIVTASDTNARIICVSGETATKFDVETYNDSATATDTAFNFIVYIQ